MVQVHPDNNIEIYQTFHKKIILSHVSFLTFIILL